MLDKFMYLEGIKKVNYVISNQNKVKKKNKKKKKKKIINQYKLMLNQDNLTQDNN